MIAMFQGIIFRHICSVSFRFTSFTRFTSITDITSFTMFNSLASKNPLTFLLKLLLLLCHRNLILTKYFALNPLSAQLYNIYISFQFHHMVGNLSFLSLADDDILILWWEVVGKTLLLPLNYNFCGHSTFPQE